VTRFVSGSMRATVSSPMLPTQREPSPSAVEQGPTPLETLATTRAGESDPAAEADATIAAAAREKRTTQAVIGAP
jgi:hypothetical protein